MGVALAAIPETVIMSAVFAAMLVSAESTLDSKYPELAVFWSISDPLE